MNIPNGSEYYNGIQNSINRRTNVSLTDDSIVAKRRYRIGRMNYTVNSIFDRQINIDNNIRYLIGKSISQENNW